ncbi:hypothetical protein E0H95_28675, partial [Pseudomonas syringae pv. tomato]|nr:hypothetical protein [Pseudomonas syringae pv. tomato]
MPNKAPKQSLALGRRRRALDHDSQARRVSALLALYGKNSPPPILQVIAADGINAITSAASQDAACKAYSRTMIGVRVQIAADCLDPREEALLEASLSCNDLQSKWHRPAIIAFFD